MRYSIKWCENVTTSTNKKKMNCQLVDTNGVTTENVSIWADFPNFDKLMNGHDVEGDLVPAKDPKYGPTLYPLYPPKPVQTTQGGRSGGFGVISKAMDKKAENIAIAQDNKEWGIKVSSTMRDAVLIATTITNNSHVEPSSGDMKDLILHWRKWLLDNWDVEQPNLPF